MIASLQLDTAKFSAEFIVVFINLRSVVHEIHTHLALVDSVSKIFTRRHFKEAMINLRPSFKDQMA